MTTAIEKKQNKTAAQVREERDEWMRKTIGNADMMAIAVKDVEEGLAKVSGGVVNGPRVARLLHLLKLAAQSNPAILQCTRGSLVGALLDAARTGLEPDGEKGALVPYKSELRFQPMYRGLIHLAAEAGVCHDVTAEPVYDGDHFEVLLGTERRIDHRPSMTAQRSYGSMIACYAVFRLRDGSIKFDVMTKREIEERRQMSRAKSGPWNDWPLEMARKTVIKHGLKLLPRVALKDATLRDAIDIDNRADVGERTISSIESADVVGYTEPASPVRGVSALKAKLNPPAPVVDGETLGVPSNLGQQVDDQREQDMLAAEREAAGEHIAASAANGPAILDSQRDELLKQMDRIGKVKAAARLDFCSEVLGVRVESIGAMSVEEATKVIDAAKAVVS